MVVVRYIMFCFVTDAKCSTAICCCVVRTDVACPHHVVGTLTTRTVCAEALVVALRCAMLTHQGTLALECIARVYTLFAAVLYRRIHVGAVACALLATCRHALHHLLARPARWGVPATTDLALPTRMFACLAQYEYANGGVDVGGGAGVSHGSFAAALHVLLALDAPHTARKAARQAGATQQPLDIEGACVQTACAWGCAWVGLGADMHNPSCERICAYVMVCFHEYYVA